MAALLFISFIVLLLIGVPVAFAIAAAALLVLLKGDVKLLILVQRMFASTDSFSLIAVPFFIFAGDLLAKGKVSKVLVEFAESSARYVKGRSFHRIRPCRYVLRSDLRFRCRYNSRCRRDSDPGVKETWLS